MRRSVKSSLNRDFSHVYVEEGAADHPETRRILAVLKDPPVIPIAHYKDVFCRTHQDFRAQKESRGLILAVKRPPFLYPGSPMCDSFGHRCFLYSSNAMNCVYDCEYCYLQGMYPSANLVLFVNTEDVFRETDRELAEHPVYLCISYDSDLLAMEHLAGLCRRWIEFARERPDLTVEIRTKSAAFGAIADLPPARNVILAWSLSPRGIAARYEHRAPPPSARIRAMKAARDRGWPVRLCVDPVLRTKDWREQYTELIREVRAAFGAEMLPELSVGVFRVPERSLKVMRKIRPDSDLLAFPFVRDPCGVRAEDGPGPKSRTYAPEQRDEMIAFLEKGFRDGAE